MSSCHLLLGRPLDLFHLLGCHSVQRLVHLLSFILATCAAHFHFCFSVHSMISIVFVIFLISEYGILSCSFRSNIFLSIALWAVLCLPFVYLEAMFGSHRSLLASHIGPLLVFQVKWGVVYLEVFPCCFFPKQLHVALILVYISFFLFSFFFFFWFVMSFRCVVCLSEVFIFCHFFNFLLIYWYVLTVCMVCRVLCLSFVYFKPTVRPLNVKKGAGEWKLFKQMWGNYCIVARHGEEDESYEEHFSCILWDKIDWGCVTKCNSLKVILWIISLLRLTITL